MNQNTSELILRGERCEHPRGLFACVPWTNAFACCSSPRWDQAALYYETAALQLQGDAATRNRAAALFEKSAQMYLCAADISAAASRFCFAARVLETNDEMRDSPRIASLYERAATIYRDHDNVYQASNYYFTAAREIMAQDMRRAQALFYMAISISSEKNNVIIAHVLRRGEVDCAVLLLIRAAEIYAQRLPDTNLYARAYLSAVAIRIKQERFEEAADLKQRLSIDSNSDEYIAACDLFGESRMPLSLAMRKHHVFQRLSNEILRFLRN